MVRSRRLKDGAAVGVIRAGPDFVLRPKEVDEGGRVGSCPSAQM
jgi:hypothetical protein